MATASTTALDAKLSRNPGKIGMIVFGVALFAGLIYTIISIAGDLGSIRTTSIFPFFLLGVALLTALGFEFVNGFHDTANAVATVIYTRDGAPYRGRLVRYVELHRGSGLLGRRGIRDHLPATR